ncbi:MAG: hypothetical protein KC620_23030 [Myxococcales bacterium]|nr:hypothetical protein [Myxococcales bacterium]
MRPLSLILCLAALPTAAWALTAEEAEQVELEKLRREVAGEVQLTAFNLLDELVYQWVQAPPFAAETPVFIADVTVPVGLGTGLAGLVENHLAELLLAHPNTRVVLADCPACKAVMVHSGKQGTVISRGFDNPEALDRLGGIGARHGLFIDFAAEGAWLVLRARITRLTPDLPIVWSRTLPASVGAPSLLRQSTGLKSADQARREYLDALHERRPFRIPISFTIRAYAAGDDVAIAPAPVVWLTSGLELPLTDAQRWKTSLVLGYSWVPEAYEGYMAQARISRLISGETVSLTGPDVYLFLGGALMTLTGDAVAQFFADNATDRATFGGLHLGFELRVGNRIGASLFIETMPAYNDSTRIGTFLNTGIVDFHSLGTEVTFCF